MSFWSHTHTYTKSGDSNTCENSYVHAALPSMPICTSALLHVFLFTHAHTYTKSGDSNACENSYAYAALLSMPFCTSTLLHVFLVTHTHIAIQNQVIAIHVRIAMFMLLCQACPFAHLLSFMSFWSHTHTYTKSGDSNTCENSYVHAALPNMPICTSTLLHVFLVTHT